MGHFSSGMYCRVAWKQLTDLSQYLTNLMHTICFTISFISCLYMFRAHVLIIRRLKLYYTASGIIMPMFQRNPLLTFYALKIKSFSFSEMLVNISQATPCHFAKVCFFFPYLRDRSTLVEIQTSYSCIPLCVLRTYNTLFY